MRSQETRAKGGVDIEMEKWEEVWQVRGSRKGQCVGAKMRGKELYEVLITGLIKLDHKDHAEDLELYFF